MTHLKGGKYSWENRINDPEFAENYPYLYSKFVHDDDDEV